MNKYKWFFLVLLAGITGYFIGINNTSNKNQSFNPIQKSDLATSKGSSNKPLGFFASVETPKGN